MSRVCCWPTRPSHRLPFRTRCARCRSPRLPSMPNSVADPHASDQPVGESAGWRWAPAWILTYVALWPAPGYAEAVLVLGALVAIFKLVVSRFRGGAQLLSNHAWALTSVLFCAYWVPELVSAFDAINRTNSFAQ